MSMRQFPQLACLALVCGLLPITAQSQGFNPEARLAEPFVGVTTDGQVMEDLFELAETGVSTTPVVNSAHDLLSALDEDMRSAIRFPVDTALWRFWANFHQFERHGVSLEAMSTVQREAVYSLLRASLSAKGYQTSRDIMRLNHHLGELVNRPEEYRLHDYWLAVMGEPSITEPWGWQLEGHHLVINYFVLGDQVVMTPTFWGSEPVRADFGDFAGAEVMQDEQDHGLALMESLDAQQQATARIGGKGRSNVEAGMFDDNAVVPYEGLAYRDMTPNQQEALHNLVGLYVGNMPEGHADIKMAEVRAHLNETYFAWRGDTSDAAVFYYRVQSAVIMIEFDHQGPIAIEGSRSQPIRDHVHSMVRTPNGNDYGRDLLRRHYEMTRNDPDHVHVGEE